MTFRTQWNTGKLARAGLVVKQWASPVWPWLPFLPSTATETSFGGPRTHRSRCLGSTRDFIFERENKNRWITKNHRILYSVFIYLFVCLFVCLGREWGSGREQEGGRESQAGSGTVSAEPEVGAQSHKPRDHDLSWNQESDAQRTEPPWCPKFCTLNGWSVWHVNYIL